MSALFFKEEMDKKYILFDLDGTLTDPKIGITSAVAYALEHCGYPVPDDLDTLCPFIGPPLHDSFSKYYGADDDEAEKLVESYTPPISIKDWGVIAGKLNKIITKLDDLSAKGKNVIILCKEKLLDEDHPEKMLSTVDILPSVRSDLTAAARVIGRTFIAKDGTHGIAVSPHAHRITKVSVYGVDTEGITSFKELLERIKNK